MDEANTDPLTKQRSQARVLLEELSPKQRAVMEIASRVGRITLKQIARELPGKDISATMVSRHLRNAQEKLGVASREAATAKFLMLSALAEPEKYEQSNLFTNPQIVEKLMSDLSNDSAPEVLMSSEFQDFLADIRSNGPKAKTAKYGPWWKVYEAGTWIAIIMVAIAAGLFVTDWLNQFFAN